MTVRPSDIVTVSPSLRRSIELLTGRKPRPCPALYLGAGSEALSGPKRARPSLHVIQGGKAS
jgi:hypothetical protein